MESGRRPRALLGPFLALVCPEVGVGRSFGVFCVVFGEAFVDLEADWGAILESLECHQEVFGINLVIKRLARISNCLFPHFFVYVLRGDKP